MERTWCGVIGFLAAGLVSAVVARSAMPAEAPDVRPAIARGLSRVQRGAASYVTHQECFSCHHQALPIMTCALARRRGVPIDEAGLQAQVDFTLNYFAPNTDEIRRGLGVQGANDTAGYALEAFAAAGKAPDENTDALAEFLLKRQLPDGSWIVSADRPPLEGSAFTSTSLAVAGLRLYAPAKRAGELPAVRERATAWLRKRKPVDTEDLVYQMRGFAAVDDRAGLEEASRTLRAQQRPDGGWAQLASLKSDAYATGQALIALNELAGVPPDDAAYRKGVAFLLQTQQADGSWIVQKRAKPVQVFFDNGDPGGKSQFISFAATNLATMALLRTLPATK
jgi:N-acyl-D-amino-acid deacylase